MCFDGMVFYHRDQSKGNVDILRMPPVTTCNIAHTRNVICQEAIDKKVTHILFIDSDMLFEKESLELLLETGKDIIGGLAVRKMDPYLPCIQCETGDDSENPEYGTIVNWVDGTIIRVSGVGSSFMLIKISILKSMSKPWFTMPIRNKELMGSDYAFCESARKAGFSVWCHTGVKLGHLGRYTYTINDFVNRGGPVKTKAETNNAEVEFESLDNYRKSLLNDTRRSA